MKKIDGFFIVILFLFSVLISIYYSAYSSLNYFENNAELTAKYERKKNLINLEARLEKIAQERNALNSERRPASVSAESKESEEQLNAGLEAGEAAKQYFLSARHSCYQEKKELDCLRTIEESVVHFPESEWTGESLVLLADFYYRTKRFGQAKDILYILKYDFKDFKGVQKKVAVIERHLI